MSLREFLNNLASAQKLFWQCKNYDSCLKIWCKTRNISPCVWRTVALLNYTCMSTIHLRNCVNDALLLFVPSVIVSFSQEWLWKKSGQFISWNSLWSGMYSFSVLVWSIGGDAYRILHFCASPKIVWHSCTKNCSFDNFRTCSGCLRSGIAHLKCLTQTWKISLQALLPRIRFNDDIREWQNWQEKRCYGTPDPPGYLFSHFNGSTFQWKRRKTDLQLRDLSKHCQSQQNTGNKVSFNKTWWQHHSDNSNNLFLSATIISLVAVCKCCGVCAKLDTQNLNRLKPDSDTQTQKCILLAAQFQSS